MSSISILVSLFLLAVFVKDGEPVQCWTCTSNLNPACGDLFLGAPSGDISSSIRLENCDANSAALYPDIVNSKSACKKQKKWISNELVIVRGCTWKRADYSGHYCPTYTDGPQETTTFCETCDHDACNGASVHSKTLALLIVPLGLLLLKYSN